MADFKKSFTRQIVNPCCGKKLETYMLKLTPGYTAIVHPQADLSKNVLLQIRKHAKKAGFTHVFQDVRGIQKIGCDWNGAAFIDSQINEAIHTGKPLCVMLHLPDTGLSPMAARDLMSDITTSLLKIHIKADQSADYPVYIIATVDNYEMARSICVNPVDGHERVFADYRDYTNWLQDHK